jgi:hypothetical protein
MSLHCEEPMRKKRRNDVLKPAFDQSAFDQLVALSGSARGEVAAEAYAALSPPAPKGTISTRDWERKLILIPSEMRTISLTHDRSWIFSNSIVASQFQFGTSQFFHSRHEFGRRLVADSYTGIVTLGLFKHGSI